METGTSLRRRPQNQFNYGDFVVFKNYPPTLWGVVRRDIFIFSLKKINVKYFRWNWYKIRDIFVKWVHPANYYVFFYVWLPIPDCAETNLFFCVSDCYENNSAFQIFFIRNWFDKVVSQWAVDMYYFMYHLTDPLVYIVYNQGKKYRHKQRWMK